MLIFINNINTNDKANDVIIPAYVLLANLSITFLSSSDLHYDGTNKSRIV